MNKYLLKVKKKYIHLLIYIEIFEISIQFFNLINVLIKNIHFV